MFSERHCAPRSRKYVNPLKIILHQDASELTQKLGKLKITATKKPNNR
jgi:hypothetical protein